MKKLIDEKRKNKKNKITKKNNKNCKYFEKYYKKCQSRFIQMIFSI